MNFFVAGFAICCIAVVAQARPGHVDLSSLALLAGSAGGSAYGGGGGGSGYGGDSAPPPPTNFQLMAVPDDSAFGSLSFPDHQIQDLGTISEGEVPPESIRVTKTITIKVPQPYPVHVPHPVPVPIHVPKPIPVPVTKVVEVPKPYPVEVTKTIPIPVEASHGGGGGGYGGDLAGGGGDYDQHGGYSANEAQIQQAPQQISQQQH